MKYINWEKMKEVASSSSFALVATAVIGVAIATPIAVTVGLNEHSKTEVKQYIGKIEYVSEGEQFLLNELYIVEKDDNKYLCSRTKVDRKGTEFLEQQIIKENLGILVPQSARDVYEYHDIKTKEVICLSEDDDVIISELTLYFAEDVNNGNLEKEEINQEYIDNIFKHNVK